MKPPGHFKSDPRSPQELASAILDHELTPRESDSPYDCRMTFRETLLYHFGTEQEMPYSRHVLWSLKALAEGLPLDRKHKRDLGHALQVIDAYRRDSAETRAVLEGEANPDLHPQHALYGRPTEEDQRAAHNSMETCAVEIGNLNAIEKLMRALAHKLNIALIEPGHRKS